MKLKTLFLSALVLASASLFAQTEKGRFMLSGSSSLQIVNSKWDNANGSATTVTFNPSLGYFVIDNLSVGVGINAASTSNASQLAFLPTFSYFFPLAGNLKPFVQLGVGYGNMKLAGSTYGGLALGVGGGLAYFLNKNVSLDLGLQYMRNDYDGNILNNLGGMLGFGVYLP